MSWPPETSSKVWWNESYNIIAAQDWRRMVFFPLSCAVITTSCLWIVYEFIMLFLHPLFCFGWNKCAVLATLFLWKIFNITALAFFSFTWSILQVWLSSFSDEDILNAVHRFRPKFLGTSDGLPTYYDPYEFEHTCLLKCEPHGDADALAADKEHVESSCKTKKCVALPFVASNQFQSNNVAEKFSSVIKEV